MKKKDDMEGSLRSAAMQTSNSILLMRQRAEQELVLAKEALERKTGELADALAVLRATLESTTDGILVTDTNGRVTDFNKKYVEMWRLPPGTMNAGNPEHPLEIASRQFKEPGQFLARVKEINASAPPETFDLLELADGRVFERSSNLQNRDGRNTGRVWNYHDVTSRRQEEIASVRLSAIVDSSDDAIVSKNLNSVVTSWNAGAEKIFGYTAAEMIGTSIMRLIPPDRKDEEEQILARITRGERMRHFDTIRLAKDGRALHVSVTVSPIKDSSGNVIGASKIARDITEGKLAEEKLRAAKIAAEKANKAKDDFLAVLSHELRTPLTPALAAASYLSEHEGFPAEFREEMLMIRRNVLLEARLIDDLLDLTRIASGKIPLHLEPVDAHRLLRHTLQIVHEDIVHKQLAVETDLAARRHHTPADAVRIQQVFWNLINNAVKFTPQGGSIAIKTSNDETGRFVFEITDSGIGIEPGQQARIFEAFEQGERAITRQFGGLGLGLTISKNLLNLHGGTISVRSEGKNRGTSFRVGLNVIAPPAATPGKASAGNADKPKSLRILVVDDHNDTRSLLSRLLSKRGHEVLTADCAGAALKILDEGRFDVLISDIGLPDSSGYELMREAKYRQPLKGIALSGFGMEEDVRRSVEAGFDFHLTKPLDFQQLQSRLQELAT